MQAVCVHAFRHVLLVNTFVLTGINVCELVNGGERTEHVSSIISPSSDCKLHR